MATSITVKMKDGTTREFPHVGRVGGSYTKTLEYQGAFAIIVDEWYNKTIIPAADIKEITTRNW